MNDIVIVWIAFGATCALAPVTQWIARRRGLVAKPKEDRWSRRETPMLGGAALVAGVLAAAAASLPLGDPRVQAVLAGALLMFAVGLWDDARRLKPATKLAAQLAAAAILVAGGVEVALAERRVIGIPLTFLWVVGITNALNLLDNMDGLAAGVGAIGALVLAAFGASSGLEWLTPLALCIAGASLGFLPWNYSPARQFLGDAGSLPLGFLLAATGILGTFREAGNVLLVLAAPVFVLAVPILDTTLVTLQRKFHGRKVSEGGKDHLSHRLVALGMGERRAVAVLWAVTAVSGGLALLVSGQVKDASPVTGLVVLGLLAAAAAIFGVVLGEVKVYHHVPAENGRAARAAETRQAFLYYLRALAVVLLDLGFVAAAFTGAHLLRFEGKGEPWAQTRFFEALPVVVVAKIAALQLFGLQKGFWRYFGLRDLAAVAKGVIAGSALAAAGLTLIFGWAGFSKPLMVLDGILLFLLLVGSRALFRIVVEHLGGFPEDGVPILLVGAGAEGDLALRSLRIRGGVRPVGVLDSDPRARGRFFHGLPVLGTPADLERVLKERPAVKEVVLARAADPAEQERVREVARAAGARLMLAPTALTFTEI